MPFLKQNRPSDSSKSQTYGPSLLGPPACRSLKEALITSALPPFRRSALQLYIMHLCTHIHSTADRSTHLPILSVYHQGATPRHSPSSSRNLGRRPMQGKYQWKAVRTPPQLESCRDPSVRTSKMLSLIMPGYTYVHNEYSVIAH